MQKRLTQLRVLWLTTGLCVAALALAGGCSGTAGSPEEVLDQMLTRLKRGDVRALHELFETHSSRGRQTETLAYLSSLDPEADGRHLRKAYANVGTVVHRRYGPDEGSYIRIRWVSGRRCPDWCFRWKEVAALTSANTVLEDRTEEPRSYRAARIDFAFLVDGGETRVLEVVLINKGEGWGFFRWPDEYVESRVLRRASEEGRRGTGASAAS